jgi:hypothetical protein
VVTLVRESVDVETATGDNATVEFDRVRARFGERPPLLEMAEGGRPHYSAERTASSTPVKPIETLHVLAWDPDEGKLARFRMPFWFVRLKTTPIEFGAYASGLDDEGVKLRVEDIEKYGPGIILDYSTSSAERVLIWAQ